MKLSPTANTTVLVTSEHPAREYRDIASQLLAEGHVHAEQVGFVRPATEASAHTRLHMAGDEFCGNAAMALATLATTDAGLRVGEVADVRLQSSGTDELVHCRVEREHDGFACRSSMPLPTAVTRLDAWSGTDAQALVVRYPDALHVVVEVRDPDAEARRRAEALADRLGAVEDVSLVGVMLLDPATRALVPLVTVPALGTRVWEHSCGSGTAAVGVYLATRSRDRVETTVRQPGGVMRVWAEHDERGVSSLVVGGQVRIVAEGRAYLHD